MLANFFGKSSPVNFIIILAVFLLSFFAHYFVGFSDVSLKEIGVFIPLLLMVFFFYNFILYKNKLTRYNSYGFLFFVILFGIFSMSNFDRNTILLHGLLLIYLRRVYSLRSPKNIFGKLFDSGFWLGILFIFNPLFSLFGVLIYQSNIMFQKTNWQTLIIPIVGFFTPLFCAFTYYFWFDETVIFWDYFNWYTSYDYSSYSELHILIPISVIGIVTLIAYFFKTPKVLVISGNYRKYWTLITVNFIISILFVLLLTSRNGSELQYLFFPISIILTNWIETIQSKILKEVVLIISLLCPFVMLIV